MVWPKKFPLLLSHSWNYKFLVTPLGFTQATWRWKYYLVYICPQSIAQFLGHRVLFLKWSTKWRNEWKVITTFVLGTTWSRGWNLQMRNTAPTFLKRLMSSEKLKMPVVNRFSPVAQLCPALCDPMDCIVCQAPLSMGILQARILEWVAMPFSRESSQPRNRTQVSHIAGRFITSWVIREAPWSSEV